MCLRKNQLEKHSKMLNLLSFTSTIVGDLYFICEVFLGMGGPKTTYIAETLHLKLEQLI